MKHHINAILLGILAIGIVAFYISHIRWPIPLDQGWSQPIAVTGTQNADAGGGNLYKWHDTLMLVQDRYDYSTKSSTCSIIIRNTDFSNSWTQLPVSDIPGDCTFYCPAFDQTNDRIMFERGYIENNQLQMGAVFIHMTANGRIQIEAERRWTRNQESLLGKTSPNVTLNDPAIMGLKVNRDYPGFGKGILTESEACIPYSLRAKTFTPPNTLSDGPYTSGIFYSTDLGKTWLIEKIADLDAGEPEVCRTKDYYYYFGMTGGGIWFSRKPVEGGLWSEPKFVTKTFAGWRGGGAVAEDGTVQYCWLDRRHEKWRPRIETPSGLGNYEVFYRQRKDSDSAWRKDVAVSKGILFSYWPSMSVEGNKIAIAWVGATDKNGSHDVFYVTSKDGGETWSKPLKVTDHAKDGFTSERTQVALQNGIIHLFYAQGQENPQAQVSQQGSWPVYYQQRPFPN
jgi:hypothetical protein